MDRAPFIRSISRTLPEHYEPQAKLSAYLKALWSKRHFNVDRVDELHKNSKVDGRYLACSLAELSTLDSLQKRNDKWIQVATDVGARSVSDALKEADLTPKDVDHVFFVTITGIATPSIDAFLVNRLGLRTNVKRSPIFGLGCLAGAAGMARAADYLRAFPDQVAVMLSVELCSLNLQEEDHSVANLIATGLFGDGASAAVLLGANRGRLGLPQVVASESVFYPGTERIMGWDVINSGFKIVLSPKVPELVRANVAGNCDAFLGKHGLKRSDVKHWAVHTGGPKVLEAFKEALQLSDGALHRSWNSLSQTGNLSSASVMFVMADLMKSGEARPGDYAVMASMGPGFCSEWVLYRF